MTPQSQLPLEWKAKLNLARNAAALKQLGFAFSLPILLIFLIMLLLNWPIRGEAVWFSLQITGGVTAVVLLFLAIVLGLFYRGGYEYQYRLDENGIRAATSGQTAKKNAVVNFLLVISGQPGPMSAGAMAQSRQSEFIGWGQVKRVTTNARQKTITLWGGKRPLTEIACNENNYEAVLQAINERI